MSTQQSEHPFAEFVKILGKGKRGSRPLTQDEAYRAMAMILADQVEPIQLGAFLMLMRIKEETAEELGDLYRQHENLLSFLNRLLKWIWTGHPMQGNAVTYPGFYFQHYCSLKMVSVFLCMVLADIPRDASIPTMY